VALQRRNSAAIPRIATFLAKVLDAIKVRGNMAALVSSERESGQSQDGYDGQLAGSGSQPKFGYQMR
jgi:hypothetical protein